MSTLLPITTVLDLCNNTSQIYKSLILSGAVDQAVSGAGIIMNTFVSDLSPTDPAQMASVIPFISGIVGSGAVITNGFGSSQGSSFGLTAYGVGRGTLNRTSVLNSAFFSYLEGLRKTLTKYGSSVSVSSLSSYATYQNTVSEYSCLYDPNFASLYYYSYSQGQQLLPTVVFAPSGITFASFNITGASGAGTVVSGYFPLINNYTYTPGTDSYGNSVYLGGLPMAQGFAPCNTCNIVYTASIGAGVTVTASGYNQSGILKTWVTTISGGHTTGYTTPMTTGTGTATSTDRIASIVEIVLLTTAGSMGSLAICSTAERVY